MYAVSDVRDGPGLHCNNITSHSYPAPPASPENEAKGMHTEQLFENISSDLSLLTSRLQFLYKRPRGDDHSLRNLVSVDGTENSISVHGPLQKRPKCLETINASVFEEATARCILDRYNLAYSKRLNKSFLFSMKVNSYSIFILNH